MTFLPPSPDSDHWHQEAHAWQEKFETLSAALQMFQHGHGSAHDIYELHDRLVEGTAIPPLTRPSAMYDLPSSSMLYTPQEEPPSHQNALSSQHEFQEDDNDAPDVVAL